MPCLIVFQEVRERRLINDPGIKKKGEKLATESDTPTLSVEAKPTHNKSLRIHFIFLLLQSKSGASGKAEQSESEII
jgi:hypothetical protein